MSILNWLNTSFELTLYWILVVIAIVLIRDSYLREIIDDITAKHRQEISEFMNKSHNELIKNHEKHESISRNNNALREQVINLSKENSELTSRVEYLSSTIRANDDFFEAGDTISTALFDTRFKPTLIVDASRNLTTE